MYIYVHILVRFRFVTVLCTYMRLRFVTVPVRNRFRITGDSSSQYVNLCCESAGFGSLAVRVGGSGSIPELPVILYSTQQQKLITYFLANLAIPDFG